MKGNTAKTALCGMVSALSLALMMFEGLVQVASIAMPALAGCLLIPIVAEAGLKWAFGSYGATAALCLLLTPDKEAALIYLLFFGDYPALCAVLGEAACVQRRGGGRGAACHICAGHTLGGYTVFADALGGCGAAANGERGVCAV